MLSRGNGITGAQAPTEMQQRVPGTHCHLKSFWCQETHFLLKFLNFLILVVSFLSSLDFFDLSTQFSKALEPPLYLYKSKFNFSVLSEAQTCRNSQLPASKNLLVLRDKESGKTTLIAKLQGNEDPKKVPVQNMVILTSETNIEMTTRAYGIGYQTVIPSIQICYVLH